jgi:hypothetical protein
MEPSESMEPSEMASMDEETEEAVAGGETSPAPSPMAAMGEDSTVATADDGPVLPQGRVALLAVAAVAALVVGALAVMVLRRWQPPPEPT